MGRREKKYDPLCRWLAGCGRAEVRLTFREIEELLGQPLPDVAHTTPAWWSNIVTEQKSRHVQAYAWSNAGYRTRDLDLPGRAVTFVREGDSK